ncbi:GNAT family N-acetyltransferase [Ralstonia mannitolilytica]|uniref:GNAT family N-acetyltransferase n=1 Tax=Ralstonia mannitolilytica TaxID=105219 RepID=UPI00292DA7B4|nr:GNAT family N-acetyltransferase [Ralstonia mannitolilytica]
MSTAHPVPLRMADGSFVEALLHERIDASDALAVDDVWLAHMAAEKQRAAAAGRPIPPLEHEHWQWAAKVKESSHLLSCPTLAVEYDGQMQGLMLLTTDGHFGKLPSETGKPIVYIRYLAVAPWNLRGMAEPPRFSGVGLIMLHAAIQLSLDAEFKGRIGLHSLPKAEGFYERQGFHCLGVDPAKENLKYYELSPQAASEFIARSTS